MNRQLTAAEAAILLQPNSQIAGKALKLFLLELTARSAISVRREGWRKKAYVTFAADGATRLPDARFARGAWPAIGGELHAGREVPIATVVDAAREAFGTGYKGFREEILRDLVETRLLSARERTLLRLIHVTMYDATVDGEETKRYIERQVSLVADSWRRGDGSAAALAQAVRELGPLVLLWPKFRKRHREIDQALQSNRGTSDDGLSYGVIYSGSGDGNDLDWSASFVWGGIGDAFGAIDSEVGGDSGGDGGDGGGD